jgi:ankyrin repeat protein
VQVEFGGLTSSTLQITPSHSNAFPSSGGSLALDSSGPNLGIRLVNAAKVNCINEVEDILSVVNTLDKDHVLDAMQEAIRNANLNMAYMLKKKCNLSDKDLGKILGCVALTWDAIEGLINDIANAKNDQDRTLLHFAAADGDADIAKKLLAIADADKFMTADGYWGSPLHSAARRNKLEVFRKILEQFPNSAKLRAYYGWTALHVAVFNESVDIVKAFAQRNDFYDLASIKDSKGQTALHVAADNGNVEIFREFFNVKDFERLASIQDDDGQTALHYAAFSGHIDVVKEFLNVNDFANLASIRSMAGLTALHLAARWKHQAVVKVILEKCPGLQ